MADDADGTGDGSGVLYAYDSLRGDKSMVPSHEVLLPNVVATTANANNPKVAKYYYKTKF